MWILPSGLIVTFEKWDYAGLNGGCNYDTLKVAKCLVGWVPACMNWPTRAPLCLFSTRRTYVSWTNSPATSIGERSPCGALLQLVAAIRLRLQSVTGRRRSVGSGWRGVNNVTPVPRDCIANSSGRTPAGGQVGWGGTPLKRYRGGPKVGSTGSELQCWGQGQKPAWQET